jgi:hypothetical protein
MNNPKYLHEAVRDRRFDDTRSALEAKASVNSVVNGLTPLHRAYKSARITALLLAHPDIDLTDPWNVCFAMKPEVALLIAERVDLFRQDAKWGRNILHCFALVNNVSVIRCLTKFGIGAMARSPDWNGHSASDCQLAKKEVEVCRTAVVDCFTTELSQVIGVGTLVNLILKYSLI